MRIAEIFRSLQGEGRLTGTESVFVRVCGCNLRCGYCDTRYASWSPEGREMTVPEILAKVEDLATPGPVRHVVLTGGEPMLFDELVPLSDALRQGGWHITVETSGTRYLPVACDLMSISPKLSNSSPPESDPRRLAYHEENRHDPQVIMRLIVEYDYQFKFVVGARPIAERWKITWPPYPTSTATGRCSCRRAWILPPFRRSPHGSNRIAPSTD